MKRCPECYEVYDDSQKFCEADGWQLLTDRAFFVAETQSSSADPDGHPGGPQPKREVWLMGLVGVIVGIFLCAGAYAAHLFWATEDLEDRETPVYASGMRESVQAVRPAASTAESNQAPEDDPALDPEAEAALEVPAESSARDNQVVAARLNQGPVSTGPRARDSEEDSEVQTVIQMEDGSIVEVDAAWEDKQGVWYRRGGLVSFVESRRVKAITARAQAKLSARDNLAP